MKTRDMLRPEQTDRIEKLKKRKRVLLTAPMGSGKTVTVLTAVSDLLSTGEIKKVLVIAPLWVASTVWVEGCAEWEHLKNLRAVKCLGDKKKRVQALKTDPDITVINISNVCWLASGFKKWPFDCIIVDESSMIKNPQAKVSKVLRRLQNKTSFIFLLSGTPMPNSYLDIWNQVYMLDAGHSLGSPFSRFRGEYFYQKPFDMYGWHLKEGSGARINKAVKKLSLSMPAPDIPSITLDMKFKLPSKARDVYAELEKRFLVHIMDEAITAENAAVLTNKLLQVCNGNLYSGQGDSRVVNLIHAEKIQRLREIREHYPEENLLIAYTFQSDRAMILDSFPEAELLSTDAVKRWNKGEIPMFLASPKSAGHGLNLQFGGSVLVWFGLTWSLEQYLQMNARLARPGQEKAVRIVRIIAENTIEDRVIRRLLEKEISQEGLLAAVREEYE